MRFTAGSVMADTAAKPGKGLTAGLPRAPDVCIQDINTLRMVLGSSVVAITLSSNICEFVDSLVYKASSRSDRVK